MSVTTKTFDTKCLELSDHFLDETPEKWRGMHRVELARAIQEAVEDYIDREVYGGRES